MPVYRVRSVLSLTRLITMFDSNAKLQLQEGDMIFSQKCWTSLYSLVFGPKSEQNVLLFKRKTKGRLISLGWEIFLPKLDPKTFV